MKRVLLISNYGWTIFNFRTCLIAKLREMGFDVFVQTQFDGYEGRLGLDAARVLPLSIDRKGINPAADCGTFLSILSAIRKTKPQVCLLFTIKPVIYGGLACTVTSTPYLPNITGLGTAFLSASWLKMVAKTLYKLGLRAARKVFFQNPADLALFVSEGLANSDRAVLIPGSGVNLERYGAAPYPVREAVVFLFIGRLLTDKGINEFVAAARVIKRAHPRVRFQVLGPADAINRTAIRREEIEGWAKSGILDYLGETDDVRPFIAAADCVVLPSYREGAPRALLEAAAMGRPIITTDATGCREVVEDGITGLMCRPKDASDLAAKMAAMMAMSADQRARMGRAGRAKMEREFDEGIVIRRYAQELQDVISAAHQT